MLSCVDALEALPSVLPIATGTTPGITTDGMATVAATNGVTSLDHWSGLFMAGDGERAVRHPGNRAPDAVAVSRRRGGPGTGLRGEHHPTAMVAPGGASFWQALPA